MATVLWRKNKIQPSHHFFFSDIRNDSSSHNHWLGVVADGKHAQHTAIIYGDVAVRVFT